MKSTSVDEKLKALIREGSLDNEDSLKRLDQLLREKANNKLKK